VERPSIGDLPYLEGDYWPGEAENQLAEMAGEGGGTERLLSLHPIEDGFSSGGIGGGEGGCLRSHRLVSSEDEVPGKVMAMSALPGYSDESMEQARIWWPVSVTVKLSPAERKVSIFVPRLRLLLFSFFQRIDTLSRMEGVPTKKGGEWPPFF